MTRVSPYRRVSRCASVPPRDVGSSSRPCSTTTQPPASISPDGHKTRRELEYEISSPNSAPAAFPEALGYLPVNTIERYVEYYHLGTAEARLEWYPRMDTLIEIEGDAAGIDAVILATGLAREEFTPEALSAFAVRFASRTGTGAAMTLAELGSELPRWPAR